MAASEADGGVASVHSDASAVVLLGKSLLDKMKKAATEGGNPEDVSRECAAAAPAMVSSMRAHSDNGDVQRVAAVVLMFSLDTLENGPGSLLVEGAPAFVEALGMSLTCSFAMPAEELNAGPNCSGSNREFESFLLILLLTFYEADEGVALIEAGVLPALIKAIKFDGDSKVSGEDAEKRTECKGRELDLLQCLLRSQPTCLKKAVDAGACDAVIASIHAHGTNHMVAASAMDALKEIMKDEASHEAVEAALQDPAIQEAITLGQLSPLALIQKEVRAGLQANREAEMAEKAKKLGLTPA